MTPRIVTDYRPRVWDDCGTQEGWNRHSRFGSKHCTDCLEYRRRYMRDRRSARTTGRAFTFPTEVRDRMRAADGLGLAIADALRGSA